MQAQLDILSHKITAERVTDNFVFEYTATGQTQWNGFDISNIIENSEVDLQVTQMTKNLVLVLNYRYIMTFHLLISLICM